MDKIMKKIYKQKYIFAVIAYLLIGVLVFISKENISYLDKFILLNTSPHFICVILIPAFAICTLLITNVLNNNYSVMLTQKNEKEYLSFKFKLLTKVINELFAILVVIQVIINNLVLNLGITISYNSIINISYSYIKLYFLIVIVAYYIEILILKRKSVIQICFMIIIIPTIIFLSGMLVDMGKIEVISPAYYLFSNIRKGHFLQPFIWLSLNSITVVVIRKCLAQVAFREGNDKC